MAASLSLSLSRIVNVKASSSIYKAAKFSSFTGTLNSSIKQTSQKGTSVVPHSKDERESRLNLVAGVPVNQTKDRKATIYLPSRTAMQSGSHNMRKWSLKFDTKQRWENPLMGWASTGDPLSNTLLEFGTREAAISYCESHGWDYEVKEPDVPVMRPKSYGANFSWNKRTRISSK